MTRRILMKKHPLLAAAVLCTLVLGAAPARGQSREAVTTIGHGERAAGVTERTDRCVIVPPHDIGSGYACRR
jgi:hypothetical protein